LHLTPKICGHPELHDRCLGYYCDVFFFFPLLFLLYE
jgi:hypothetical protein